MSTLNELLDLSRELESKLIDSGGLFTPEIEALVTTLDVSLPEKIDSYAMVIDRIESNAEWFAQQAEKYALIEKGLKKSSEGIRQRLKELMLANSMDELLGDIERFKLSPSKPKLIVNDDLVPDNYLMETRTITPDKDAIREALGKGEAVQGCKLEPTFALRRFVRK